MTYEERFRVDVAAAWREHYEGEAEAAFIDAIVSAAEDWAHDKGQDRYNDGLADQREIDRS